MKNKGIIKLAGICKSIDSGVCRINYGHISNWRERNSTLMMDENLPSKITDTDLKPNVYLPLEAVDNLFSVLIISELNSPFSFV